MKTRNGFVSNSSSSSFCIYGTCIENDYYSILKKMYKNSPEIFERMEKNILAYGEGGLDVEKIKEWLDDVKNGKSESNIDISEIDGYEDIDWAGEIESAINDGKKNNGFGINVPYEEDMYIGKEWKNIPGNMTGDEFKEDIEKALSKIFGKIKCETYEEAWRDG